MQVLPPGVKHGEKADGGAEQSRVGGGVEQRSGGAAKQDVINLARVLKSQAPDRRGFANSDATTPGASAGAKFAGRGDLSPGALTAHYDGHRCHRV
jgi:hypothetical protein